jgi:hypothetical protein
MILHGVITLETIIQSMKVFSWNVIGTKPIFESHSWRNTDVKEYLHFEIWSSVTGQLRNEMSETRLLKDIKGSRMREGKKKEYTKGKTAYKIHITDLSIS